MIGSRLFLSLAVTWEQDILLFVATSVCGCHFHSMDLWGQNRLWWQLWSRVVLTESNQGMEGKTGVFSTVC